MPKVKLDNIKLVNLIKEINKIASLNSNLKNIYETFSNVPIDITAKWIHNNLNKMQQDYKKDDF